MNNETLKALFKKFASKDELRPYLCKPWTFDGINLSTDAIKLIYCPSDKYQLDFSELQDEKWKNNFKKFADKTFDYASSFEFSLSELKGKLSNVLVDEVVYDICNECDGAGECDHCGHECEACDGNGTIGEGKKTGRQIIHEFHTYEFSNGVFMRASVLDQLVTSCYLLQIDKVTYFPGESKAPQYFRLEGEITLVLMPCIYNNVLVDKAEADDPTLLTNIEFPTKK